MDLGQEAAHVGNRLFAYRDALGWSQSEVARRAGISRTSVVLTESGRSTPRLPTLRRLARAFGVGVDEFLSDREPKPRPLAEAADLLERLRGLPADERWLLLRGAWGEWSTDPEADARGMDLAIRFQSESGATIDELRRALVELEPLEARRLLGESVRHREEVVRYWQRLLFEAVAKGEIKPGEAVSKAEAFGAT